MIPLVTASGFLHDMPSDIDTLLKKDAHLRSLWGKLTPLAQNEWICYVTIVKKEVTRQEHLRRLKEDITGGKKRPCCWPGCPHRRESARKWFPK